MSRLETGEIYRRIAACSPGSDAYEAFEPNRHSNNPEDFLYLSDKLSVVQKQTFRLMMQENIGRAEYSPAQNRLLEDLRQFTQNFYCSNVSVLTAISIKIFSLMPSSGASKKLQNLTHQFVATLHCWASSQPDEYGANINTLVSRFADFQLNWDPIDQNLAQKIDLLARCIIDENSSFLCMPTTWILKVSDERVPRGTDNMAPAVIASLKTQLDLLYKGLRKKTKRKCEKIYIKLIDELIETQKAQSVETLSSFIEFLQIAADDFKLSMPAHLLRISLKPNYEILTILSVQNEIASEDIVAWTDQVTEWQSEWLSTQAEYFPIESAFTFQLLNQLPRDVSGVFSYNGIYIIFTAFMQELKNRRSCKNGSYLPFIATDLRLEIKKSDLKDQLEASLGSVLHYGDLFDFDERFSGPICKRKEQTSESNLQFNNKYRQLVFEWIFSQQAAPCLLKEIWGSEKSFKENIATYRKDWSSRLGHECPEEHLTDLKTFQSQIQDVVRCIEDLSAFHFELLPLLHDPFVDSNDLNDRAGQVQHLAHQCSITDTMDQLEESLIFLNHHMSEKDLFQSFGVVTLRSSQLIRELLNPLISMGAERALTPKSPSSVKKSSTSSSLENPERPRDGLAQIPLSIETAPSNTALFLDHLSRLPRSGDLGDHICTIYSHFHSNLPWKQTAISQAVALAYEAAFSHDNSHNLIRCDEHVDETALKRATDQVKAISTQRSNQLLSDNETLHLLSAIERHKLTSETSFPALSDKYYELDLPTLTSTHLKAPLAEPVRDDEPVSNVHFRDRRIELTIERIHTNLDAYEMLMSRPVNFSTSLFHMRYLFSTLSHLAQAIACAIVLRQPLASDGKHVAFFQIHENRPLFNSHNVNDFLPYLKGQFRFTPEQKKALEAIGPASSIHSRYLEEQPDELATNLKNLRKAPYKALVELEKLLQVAVPAIQHMLDRLPQLLEEIL